MAPTTRAPRKARPRKKLVAKPIAKATAKSKPTAKRGAGMVGAALAAFAHEVRTPLTGILAVSDLLATSDLGERERRWVDTIKAGAEHLAGLATLFVDAARASGPGLTLRNDFFDLRALAFSVGDSLAGRAAAKGLTAEIEIADDLPPFVTGDATRLRAALENLIDNAVKFTDRGSVSLRVTRKRGAKGQVGVAFAIADSGIGVTVAEIKRLFRPFSQANVSIAARFGGAGLGLSSVRQIARAMGGDISVAPQRGHSDAKGAVFTLKVLLSPAAAPAEAATATDVSEWPHAPLRILSVEDNPFGRVVLNAILTELGHQAEFTGRGEDAAGRVAAGEFDAVLMDMVLPGLSGVEAIRQIRALPLPHGQIAIIGVSGRGEDEAAARAAGAGGFLIKPVSPRALAVALLAARRLSAAAP